jgi:hypothetical protein
MIVYQRIRVRVRANLFISLPLIVDLIVTALQARTFAVWTLTSAVVRLYAAYHIEKKVYV